MPLQNRVSPFGEIIAHEARGSLMGNRGILHNNNQKLGIARWKLKPWLICVLKFKGRRRTVMKPNRYTELFFHDEAVALSAGHRPCAECQRARFNEFAEIWRKVHGSEIDGSRPRVKEMDDILHRQRVDSKTRKKLTRRLKPSDVSNGCFIHYEGTAYLKWHGTFYPWSFDEGYGEPKMIRASLEIELLTPPSTAAVIAAGFVPKVVGL